VGGIELKELSNGADATWRKGKGEVEDEGEGGESFLGNDGDTTGCNTGNHASAKTRVAADNGSWDACSKRDNPKRKACGRIAGHSQGIAPSLTDSVGQ